MTHINTVRTLYCYRLLNGFGLGFRVQERGVGTSIRTSSRVLSHTVGSCFLKSVMKTTVPPWISRERLVKDFSASSWVASRVRISRKMVTIDCSYDNVSMCSLCCTCTTHRQSVRQHTHTSTHKDLGVHVGFDLVEDVKNGKDHARGPSLLRSSETSFVLFVRIHPSYRR